MTVITTTADDVAPDTLTASAPRFLVELIAWIAAPWALASRSIALAVLADVLLVGLPTVFGMPRAKRQRTPIHITALPAIALELLQPVAAAVAAFVAWPTWLAVGVTALAGVACLLQISRWRWMLRA